MYYMVTALSEFTKKIVVLAFKNMLTTWVSKDYHKGCWLWFRKWNIWLKLCPKLLLLTELKKELMNTVAMRKYQQKILKKFELFKAVFFFFLPNCVECTHAVSCAHCYFFLPVCDQTLSKPVYIALCFVIKVLIFSILFNVLSWTYVLKTWTVNLYKLCPKSNNSKYH